MLVMFKSKCVLHLAVTISVSLDQLFLNFVFFILYLTLTSKEIKYLKIFTINLLGHSMAPFSAMHSFSLFSLKFQIAIPKYSYLIQPLPLRSMCTLFRILTV